MTVKVAALGYCLKHKTDVVPDRLATLGLDGIPELISDQTVDLRARDADAFIWTMQAALADELGGLESIDPTHGVPTSCTQCGGSLVWGEGPHAGDDRVLAKTAFAWECSSCRAAGLLMLTQTLASARPHY